MTVDDVLAYMASRPKRERPTELKSDIAMLKVWILLRNDLDFRRDVVKRHCLEEYKSFDDRPDHHEHAIGNAWGHAVQVFLESKVKQ